MSSISLLELAEDALNKGEQDTAVNGMQLIHKSLVKLEALVTDILELAQTKNMDEVPEAMDIAALFDDVCSKFSKMENFERLDFQTDF